MLHLLDEALEAMVRSRLANPGVDVSFHAPDGDWSAGISRPTVNLYLWDLRPSDEAAMGIETVQDDDGRVVRKPMNPRIELRYLITAWASSERDEHQLLGALVSALSRPIQMDPDMLSDGLRAITPLPTVSLATREPGDRADFWTALGGRYHAGLDLLVKASVDPGVVWDTAPPPSSVELETEDRREPARRSRSRRVAGVVRDPDAVGAVVRTHRGRGTVGPDGHFLVPGSPGDEIVVETRPPRRATVPDHGPVEVD